MDLAQRVTGLQQWELKLYTLTKILQSVASRMSFVGMKLHSANKNPDVCKYVGGRADRVFAAFYKKEKREDFTHGSSRSKKGNSGQ